MAPGSEGRRRDYVWCLSIQDTLLCPGSFLPLTLPALFYLTQSHLFAASVKWFTRSLFSELVMFAAHCWRQRQDAASEGGNNSWKLNAELASQTTLSLAHLHLLFFLSSSHVALTEIRPNILNTQDATSGNFRGNSEASATRRKWRRPLKRSVEMVELDYRR